MNTQEKIRQLVNKARHDEAKSYEEALEIEKEHDSCILEETHYDGKVEFTQNIVYDWKRSEIYGSDKPKIKILGRPITAFDVCWALNKKQSEHHYFADECGISDYYSVYRTIQNETLEFETIKPDGTHTTLEDWDNKICKTIARYFKK